MRLQVILIKCLSYFVLNGFISFHKMQIQRPKRIQPITADELNKDYPGRENIISVEILDELAALKAVNDKLEKAKGA